jgi:hypothetical protein
MRTKCKMCKIKRPLWKSESFLGVKCNKHFVPLIILKEHRLELTEKEKIELINICEEKYPKLFLDDSISDSDEHWHIHLAKKKNGTSL